MDLDGFVNGLIRFFVVDQDNHLDSGIFKGIFHHCESGSFSALLLVIFWKILRVFIHPAV